MLKLKAILLLLAVQAIEIISQSVDLYQQCAGDKNFKPVQCKVGQCFIKDQYYGQCLYSCPSGWQCKSSPLTSTSKTTTTLSSSNRPEVTTKPLVSPTTSSNKPVVTTNGSSSGSSSLLSDCLFKFGRRFDWNDPSKMNVYDGHDYVYQWLGAIKNSDNCSTEGNNPARLSCTDFNQYDTGRMLEYANKANKPVLFYTYIIAFEARNKFGIKDCNVASSNTLCTHGTKFIKENYDLILERYDHNTRKIASYLGRNSNSVFMIEPDFIQYHIQAHSEQGQKQVAGLLDGNYMRKLFDDLVRKIKTNLPNARISFDVKAWIGKNKFTEWWSYFKSAQIDFVNTSGGDSVASTIEIKREPSLGDDNLRWKYVTELTGKKMIADCGIGAGGQNVNNRDQWLNLNNVQARANDGVVAVNIDYKCWENNENTCLNAKKPTFNVKTC